MKTAQFTNWTNEDFVGFWDGKPRKIGAGESLSMPDYLAKHFAKHLTNRELLRTDAKGELVYKNGDKMTSPKFPEQVQLFTELFNKACSVEESESIGEKKDDIDTLIEVANRNKKDKKLAPSSELVTPTMDDDEEFESKPVESK